MENKKKFKFNLIDALIILLVLGVIFALYKIFVTPVAEEKKAETYSVEYVVLVNNINDSLFPSPFEVGDIVTSPTDGTAIGTVVAEPERKPSYVAGLDHTANGGKGAEVYTELEGISDYYITIRCDNCIKNEWGYKSSDVDMPVGSQTRILIGDMDVTVNPLKMTVLDK